jgi:hypothetical protein
VRQATEDYLASEDAIALWLEECCVVGPAHKGRSAVCLRVRAHLHRCGVSNELARVLVAIGIPDAPMQVHSAGLCGYAAYRSFHEAAKRTYEESATGPMHRVRWVDPAVRAARITAAFGRKQG